jgi:hypothetical protein
MQMPEQMRAYGRANALNRSADQSERTMMQRRRLQKADPLAERPDLIGPNPTNPNPAIPDPATTGDPTEIADAEIAAAVAGLMKEYQSATSATPTTASQIPAAAPLRYTHPTPPPNPNAAQTDPPRNSAIPRQNRAHHPG